MLDFYDIPLMHRWFNAPHVQAFYSLHDWSEKEVLAKLTPYITGEKPVVGGIVLIDKQPIGYVQTYKVADYPWPNQDLSQEIIDSAAGMDIFIGDETMIGCGVGQRIIEQFLKIYIWPKFNYCFVDPNIKHQAAIHCYQKVGFKTHKVIETEDAMGRAEQVQLMMLHCGENA